MLTEINRCYLQADFPRCRLPQLAVQQLPGQAKTQRQTNPLHLHETSAMCLRWKCCAPSPLQLSSQRQWRWKATGCSRQRQSLAPARQVVGVHA